MKDFSLVIAIAILFSGYIARPALAEETGLDITADSEEIIVESLEFTFAADSTPALKAPPNDPVEVDEDNTDEIAPEADVSNGFTFSTNEEVIVVEQVEISVTSENEQSNEVQTSVADPTLIDIDGTEVSTNNENTEEPTLADTVVATVESSELETLEVIADVNSGDDTSAIINNTSDSNLLEAVETNNEIALTEEGIENHILVTYLNETLLDEIVFTTSTYFTDSSGADYFNTSTTALGVLANALRQNNVDITIEGGWGYYVSSIREHTASGYDGWKYSVNQIEGTVGINNMEIQDGESLQVFYGVWPWKITSDVTSTIVGEDITFSTWEYTTSTQEWNLLPSTTISINDSIVSTDELGKYVFTTTSTVTTTAFIYDGTSSWPQNSTSIDVLVLEEVSTEDITNNDGGGPGIQTTNDFSPTNEEIQAATDALMDYMKAQQNDDGSIVDGGTTDWLLMSSAAYGENPYEIVTASSSLMDFALEYDLSGFTNLNDCTGYSLHIIALLAGGIDVTDAKIRELETHMTTYCYVDHTYGLDTLNDDAFALISLLATGHTTDEEIMIDLLNAIETSQTETGLFEWPWGGGTDLTGLALNSLVYAQTKGMEVDQTVIDNSKQFLKNTQFSDGGWGDYGSTDLLTTSWVMMGINALGESQDEWLTDEGYTPWNPLVAAVNDEGYYESAWGAGPDWFSMKHAVPALLSASWPIIDDFEPPEPDDDEIILPPPPSPSYKNPTTTEKIATTTLDIVTSTEDILEEISTTTDEIIVEEKTEPLPIAIGGGPDEFIDIEPVVAGKKIFEKITPTDDIVEDKKAHPEKIIVEQEDHVEEVLQTKNNVFGISLGITVIIAIALGWRFLRTLV
mgnify:CR=1 FL=1